MATYANTYKFIVQTNKKIPAYARSNASPFLMLQTARNLFGGIGSRNALLDVYKSGDGTQASGTVTFTGALSHGSGSSNAAFTFIAGSSGACTVTVGSHTGLTVTGSGTAATDATALAAVIQTALGSDFTVTANAGDVRIIATVYGSYNFTTTVTATGGGKLSAAGATLTSGTPTGSLGTLTVGATAITLGSVPSSATVGTSVDALAASIAATCNANTTVATFGTFTGAVVSHNPVITFTATLPPEQAVVGNQIALSATVGSASGAALTGGANATANSYNY